MRERGKWGKCQQHSVCWQIDQEQELEQNLGAVLATGTAGAASQPSLKCKRKIAWENFLNFSANIWLLQNKETMWKNNAAATQHHIASHRNASHRMNIYTYMYLYISYTYIFYIFLRLTFELSSEWERESYKNNVENSPQTCESCFKSEGISDRREP